MSMSFIVFILGTIVGSFLNVCIYRLPREKSIISLHYFCPSCEGPIGFYDNIPILSYVLLKSRCRNCNTKISIRYPTVEFITALLFLLLYKKTGLNIELLVLMLFVAVLIVISLIDFEFKIIPDILSLGGLVIGFMLSFTRPFFGLLDSLYGILLGGGVLFAIAYLYQLCAKREGLGGGDIKLLGMIGSFIGIKGVLFSLISGSLVGTIVGIPLMLIKGQDTKYGIPFGPFLSFGAIVYIFYGNMFIIMLLNLLRK
ncbi:MAG TPA: prepilin peptidase [Syntrophorhabdaceae bacterium]|nr:prepilin peptidase [Syntrophorhabdaceae bacterium]